jgi:hypothetical protein
MRTNGNRVSGGSASETKERDLELENIIGNLMIAEYQVDKLRHKLVEKINPPYSAGQAKDHSAYSFKVGSKWYRVSVKIEEQKLGIEAEKG